MSDHPATKWDVYRDEDGNPVTITEEQMHAIWHAMSVVEQVRYTEGCRSLYANGAVEFYKSRLLGRMVLGGKPPYDEKPPHEVGACAYWLWDNPTEPKTCPHRWCVGCQAYTVTTWTPQGRPICTAHDRPFPQGSPAPNCPACAKMNVD